MAEPIENGLEHEISIVPTWKKKLVPENLRVHKSNSTSSLFIDSTISSPKTPELLRCFAEFYFKLIQSPDKANNEEVQTFEIFDERRHPLTSRKVDLVNIPLLLIVEKYIKDIYKVGQLAPEALIMGIGYLKRIMETAHLKIYTFNWRRVILACLILASKVWEDQAVWNVDFIDMFPATTPYDLGQMEKKLLGLLTFDVSLKASSYAQIYFDLRAESNSTEEHFRELKPLDKEGQDRLELNSSNYGEKHWTNMRKMPRSTGSFDNLGGLKSPRAVLN
jgi:hypothetical protein